MLGQNIGGTLVWYKGDLCLQISPVKQGKSHFWLRLHQTLGITDRDLNLCAIYIPPVNSHYFDVSCVWSVSPLFTTPTITHQNNFDFEINQSGREVVHLCWAIVL